VFSQSLLAKHVSDVGGTNTQDDYIRQLRRSAARAPCDSSVLSRIGHVLGTTAPSQVSQVIVGSDAVGVTRLCAKRTPANKCAKHEMMHAFGMSKHLMATTAILPAVHVVGCVVILAVEIATPLVMRLLLARLAVDDVARLYLHGFSSANTESAL
jgi:hypothetical protein